MEIQCVYGLDMGFSYSVLSIITTSLIASAIAYSVIGRNRNSMEISRFLQLI